MSENRTHLVFWPRVGLNQQASLLWDFYGTSDDEMSSSPPDEGSDPESEAHIHYDLRNKTTTMPEKLFKVIIIGDPAVGKTAFIQRYMQNTYKKDYKGTVGVDFALKVLEWSETQTVKLQLWDIADVSLFIVGQERFTWMTRVYFKDSHGCIIMFDVNNKNSFFNTLKWKKDVDSKCSLPDGSPIPCMLLANKCDLTRRQVDQTEIVELYNKNSFIGWTETSAKENLMVDESMRFLVAAMMKQDPGITNVHTGSLKLTGPGPQPDRSNCYC